MLPLATACRSKYQRRVAKPMRHRRIGWKTPRIDLEIPPSQMLETGVPVGDSSTVEQRTLTPSILVRIQVPQPRPASPAILHDLPASPAEAHSAPPSPATPASEPSAAANGAPTIFFIHIEKTGGTSLRESAIEEFSADRVVTLYGKHSRTTSGPAAEIFAKRAVTRQQKLAKLSAYLSASGIRFFSSHISDFWKLDCFDPRYAVTLLRSPAERTLSNFFFDRRMGRLRHSSFPEYFRDPRNQNIQAKRFSAVPLSKLGLVGITEDYEAFVQVFNRKFGVQFPVRHEKRGSLAYRLRSILLVHRYRREIEALNGEDCEHYAEAKALWAKAKASF